MCWCSDNNNLYSWVDWAFSLLMCFHLINIVQCIFDISTTPWPVFSLWSYETSANVRIYFYVFSPHYGDVIMGTTASQITSLTIVYSTVYSSAYQRKHQSSASLAFVRRIHRGTGEFPAQMASNADFFFHLMTSSCIVIVNSSPFSSPYIYIK